MGSVTVTGGRSNPRGAAAALLKDIINIYRPPFWPTLVRAICSTGPAETPARAHGSVSAN